MTHLIALSEATPTLRWKFFLTLSISVSVIVHRIIRLPWRLLFPQLLHCDQLSCPLPFLHIITSIPFRHRSAHSSYNFSFSLLFNAPCCYCCCCWCYTCSDTLAAACGISLTWSAPGDYPTRLASLCGPQRSFIEWFMPNFSLVLWFLFFLLPTCISNCRRCLKLDHMSYNSSVPWPMLTSRQSRSRTREYTSTVWHTVYNQNNNRRWIPRMFRVDKQSPETLFIERLFTVHEYFENPSILDTIVTLPTKLSNIASNAKLENCHERAISVIHEM